MSTRAKLTALIDDKAANQQLSLTSQEVAEQLNLSNQAASNLLSRFVRDGMLDRVSRGHFAVRQIGAFGTRAASESVALAVGAAFSNEPHRISHRSALASHALIVYPARTIQVSFARRVEIPQVSGRKLTAIAESIDTISIGREPAGNGAFVSSVDRAILECANRLALCGGWGAIAQALQTGRFDQMRLEALARELNMSPALRRIASIADAMDMSRRTWKIRMPTRNKHPILLDPIENEDARTWLDSKWNVVWPESPKQMIGGVTS